MIDDFGLGCVEASLVCAANAGNINEVVKSLK